MTCTWHFSGIIPMHHRQASPYIEVSQVTGKNELISSSALKLSRKSGESPNFEE